MTTSFALLAIRIWWLLVAALAVVGAACGYIAVRDTPYQSTSTLRVDTAGYDEVSQKSIVETARILVDSNRTYSLIAGNDLAKIEALRQRTTVEVQLNSSVLLITVTDRSSAQAEHDANALADTAIVNFQQLANDQFNKTVTSGQGALTTGRLADPVAEAARRAAVGQAIAAQQDTALRLSAELSRVGAVTPAVKVGLSGSIAGIMGALAGIFVGVCAALALGVGRRRIKRLADLETLAPTVARCEPIPMDGIARVAAEANRIMHPLVVVLALRRADDALGPVTASLRAELSRDGTRAFHLEHDEVRLMLAVERADGGAKGPGAVSRQRTTAEMAAPALGMPRRAADLAAVDADLLLVTGRADDRNLHHVAARADVILLVCGWRRTRASAVIEATRKLPMEPLPYVVLTDPGARRGRLRALLSRSRKSTRVSDPGFAEFESEFSEPAMLPEHESPTVLDHDSSAPADDESPALANVDAPTLVDHVTPVSLVHASRPSTRKEPEPAEVEEPAQESSTPADHESPVLADVGSPTLVDHESPDPADVDAPTLVDHESPDPADVDAPTLVDHLTPVSLVRASRPSTQKEPEPAEVEERVSPAAADRPHRPRPSPRPRPSYPEMVRSVAAGQRGEG